MRVLEVAGICVVALFALLFAIFFRRRLLMVGGGTIRLQVRISTMVPGRGWSTGVGQFVGDELRFHRMFSLAIRPKRILDRRSLTVEERRLPSGPERLAMAETTVTGFLSWLEAGPPRDPGSLRGRPVFGPRPIEG
jgi:hypothetical protein